MPSGRTHDRITVWSLPLVAALGLAVTRQSGLTLSLCAGFLFGGLMLGPDLDTHSIHYKRWGWFRWIWIPYRGSLKHRSPLSHAPVTGTVVRVVYLMAWLSFAILMIIAIVNELGRLGWTWGDIAQVFSEWLLRYKDEIFTFGVGLELGAFSHYTADWLVSTHKRVQRQGWSALVSSSKKRQRPKSSKRRS